MPERGPTYDKTQFVFSLRSPYAWMAARWVLPKLPPSVELVWRPFFPLPSFDNFPPPVQAKTRYLVRDVMRLVEDYGGEVRFPSTDDVDWSFVHCAFLEAQAQGRGPEFALAVWDARFGRGEDVGQEAILEKAAADTGLDVAALMNAASSAANREALRNEVQRAYDEEGIFGVPTLILPRGTRFWGHDRIEWALRKGLIA